MVGERTLEGFLKGMLILQVLGRYNAAEKKDYLRFTEWDKYKTAASMATNFNAQRSDGLLQNVSGSPEHYTVTLMCFLKMLAQRMDCSPGCLELCTTLNRGTHI